MFTAQELAADAANIKATMGLDVASPNLAVVSVAHSYGFSNIVLPLLLQGHPLVHVPDALPGSLRRAFTLGESFTLPAVPAMWRAWHHAGLLKGSPVTLAISAGAPLPLELERAVFAESGLKLHNFYGSSECGGIAYDSSGEPREDASFAGTAMSGVTVTTDEDGCLVVRGANVAQGYFAADEMILGKGRFVTSDLVELNEGRVFMRGRVSDAINVAGRKLNPADVEAALLACPGVNHAVVFGVPSSDATRCEEIVAGVNASNAELTPAKLIEWLGNRLPLWQVPRKFWFCNELNADCRGKTPRRVWREKWLLLASN
jgi:acyl-coenzyme A synthetase/AMP-(fatty) acid ligase